MSGGVTEVTLDEIEVVAGDAKVDVTKPSPTENAGNTTDTPTQTTEQTSGALNTLSNGDLPWAKVALPTTSAGHGGIGEGRHGLEPETWVYGIFLDGDACQQPLILGVISGGPGGGSGRGGSDGSGTGSVGSGEALAGSGINTAGTGGSNAEKAYDILIRNGYSPQNAAGIVGNLIRESTNKGDIDPTIKERSGGGGFGIAQWTGSSRQNALKNFAGSKYNTLEGQMGFLIHELRTSEKRAERLLQNSRNSVANSTLAFLNFERPKGYSGKYAAMNGGQGVPPGSKLAKDRIATAEDFYKKMQGRSSPSSSPTPAAQTSAPAKVTPYTSPSNGQFAITGVTGS